jgi:hypothetical protein
MSCRQWGLVNRCFYRFLSRNALIRVRVSGDVRPMEMLSTALSMAARWLESSAWTMNSLVRAMASGLPFRMSATVASTEASKSSLGTERVMMLMRAASMPGNAAHKSHHDGRRHDAVAHFWICQQR